MKVTFLASGRDQDCGINSYTTSIENALDINHNRVGVKSKSLDFLHYAQSAFKSLRDESDVVHIQHEYGIFGPASICSWGVIFALIFGKFFTSKKIVVTYHSAWNSETPDPPLAALKQLYIYLNNMLWLFVTDHAIFLSNNTLNDFQQSHDVESYTVTTHGVQVETVDRSRSDAKKTLGGDGDEFHIVEPGFIRPEKGHKEFLEIARRMPDTQFVIAGGQRTGDIEWFVEEIKDEAPENVTITGVLNDTEFHDSFIGADIVLLPYGDVTQSGILNWSIAYETPVVAKWSEYFKGVAGKTDGVKLYNDVREAKDILDRLKGNPDELEEMSNAVIDYKEMNSMGKISQVHEEIYR